LGQTHDDQRQQQHQVLVGVQIALPAIH
jgi:hypothetical protein